MRNFWEIYAVGNGTLGLSAGLYIAVTSCTELKRFTSESKLVCILLNLFPELPMFF